MTWEELKEEAKKMGCKMSGTGKINDFFPLGTALVREVSFSAPTYFSIQIELDRLKEENECLREQLKEANEVIKGYSKLESLMNCAFGPMENCPSQKYIEKWGVK